MRRTLLSLAAAVSLGLLVPAWAHAHAGRAAAPVDPLLEHSTELLRSAPPATAAVALPLGLIAGALVALAARRRPRRALVLGLVALLVVFEVEVGIHSVHHLGERATTACAIAAATGHLALCLDDGPPVVSLSLVPAGAVADEQLSSPAAPGFGPDLARAPPAPIA